MTFQELKIEDRFLQAGDNQDVVFVKTSKTQYAKWFKDRVSFIKATAKQTMVVYPIRTAE